MACDKIARKRPSHGEADGGRHRDGKDGDGHVGPPAMGRTGVVRKRMCAPPSSSGVVRATMPSSPRSMTKRVMRGSGRSAKPSTRAASLASARPASAMVPEPEDSSATWAAISAVRRRAWASNFRTCAWAMSAEPMATKPTGGTVAKKEAEEEPLAGGARSFGAVEQPTIDSGSASSSARATAARTATCSGSAAAASTMMPKRARLTAVSKSSSAGRNGVRRKSTVVLGEQRGENGRRIARHRRQPGDVFRLDGRSTRARARAGRSGFCACARRAETIRGRPGEPPSPGRISARRASPRLRAARTAGRIRPARRKR